MHATFDKINSVIVPATDKISARRNTGYTYQTITIRKPLAGVVRTGQPTPAGCELAAAWLAALAQVASTFSGPAAQEPAPALTQMRLLISWDDMMAVLHSTGVSRRVDAAMMNVCDHWLLSAVSGLHGSIARLLFLENSFAPCGRPTDLRFTDSARITADENCSFATEPEIRCWNIVRLLRQWRQMPPSGADL